MLVYNKLPTVSLLCKTTEDINELFDCIQSFRVLIIFSILYWSVTMHVLGAEAAKVPIAALLDQRDQIWSTA